MKHPSLVGLDKLFYAVGLCFAISALLQIVTSCQDGAGQWKEKYLNRHRRIASHHAEGFCLLNCGVPYASDGNATKRVIEQLTSILVDTLELVSSRYDVYEGFEAPADQGRNHKLGRTQDARQLPLPNLNTSLFSARTGAQHRLSHFGNNGGQRRDPDSKQSDNHRENERTPAVGQD